MLGSSIVNKQRQIKKELKEGYRFDHWFTPAKVQSMLSWDEPCDTAIVASCPECPIYPFPVSCYRDCF